MKKKYAIFAGIALGAFAAAGSDCIPAVEMCTQADLPSCNHYGETVVGIRPDCECTLFGDIIIEDEGGSGGGGSGGGHFSMSADPGWTILGVSAAIDIVSLTTRSELYDAPVTSQPLVITSQTQSGGQRTFTFAKMDPSIVAISTQTDLGLTVVWDGPAVVHLRNPQGQTVHHSLPPRAFLPVAMSDDCDTRTLDGTAEYGPLNLEVEVSFTSPGC